MTEERKNNKGLKHDSFIKNIMADSKIAKDFLNAHLPSSFKEEVDLDTLKPEKESFVEDDLKQRMSDVIYSFKTKDGDKAYSYVLLEHQSTPDPLMPFRLWHYMYLLCERFLKRNKKHKLPLIAPIVVYNGSTKYTAPRNLWQMFTDPEKAKELIAGDYKLVDLYSTTDEELEKQGLLGMLEYFMKHVKNREILKLWEDVFKHFDRAILIDAEENYIYLKQLIWYSDSKTNENQEKQLNRFILEQLNKDGEQLMRTIADKYIDIGVEKGVQQGLEKGVQQGASQKTIEITMNMLKSNLSMKVISQVTGLTEDEILKIKARN